MRFRTRDAVLVMAVGVTSFSIKIINHLILSKVLLDPSLLQKFDFYFETFA